VPLALIILLNLVLLATLAVVLYFVLRPKPPEATKGELPGGVPNVPAPKAPAAPTVPSAPAPKP